jgi:hypothetical protein
MYAVQLPVKDILCLRRVCRDLDDMMGERVVWSLVLADILEVVHLPFLQHTMHVLQGTSTAGLPCGSTSTAFSTAMSLNLPMFNHTPLAPM